MDCATKYGRQISSLKEEISNCLSDFHALLTTPFSYNISKASTDLQLELIDSQNENILKENLKEWDLITDLYASQKMISSQI